MNWRSPASLVRRPGKNPPLQELRIGGGSLPPVVRGKLPPPILSSCSGGFFPGLRTSEEGERQFITAFAQAGVKLDYWWIDAGWYACADWPQTGTWSPDPTRYPRGFKPISELAHSKGMGGSLSGLSRSESRPARSSTRTTPPGCSALTASRSCSIWATRRRASG